MTLRESYKGYVLEADPVRRGGRWVAGIIIELHQGTTVQGQCLRRGLPSRLHLRGDEPSSSSTPTSGIDCGACEPVCPVKAIFVEDETPEQWKSYIELNRQFFVDNPGVQACTSRN